MNTKAGVVSTEYLISLTLSKINAQKMDPANPITVAKMKEEKMLPKIMPNSTCCDLMASSSAKASTMLNTLPMAASKMSMMAGFSDMRICLTMGMTTADAVPPNMQPKIMLMTGSSSKTSQPTNQMAMAERMKFNAVSFNAPLKESFNALNLSCVPLSNRMVTKVMPENRLPALPRLSGETQWNTGPMSRPMMMRNSTSGMRLRLKISLKRWAVKIPSPAFITCRLLDHRHSDWREMVPHSGFDLHFSDNE